MDPSAQDLSLASGHSAAEAYRYHNSVGGGGVRLSPTVRTKLFWERTRRHQTAEDKTNRYGSQLMR